MRTKLAHAMSRWNDARDLHTNGCLLANNRIMWDYSILELAMYEWWWYIICLLTLPTSMSCLRCCSLWETTREGFTDNNSVNQTSQLFVVLQNYNLFYLNLFSSKHNVMSFEVLVLHTYEHYWFTTQTVQ